MSIKTMNVNESTKIPLRDGGLKNNGTRVSDSGEEVVAADFILKLIARYGTKVYARNVYYTVTAVDSDGGVAGLVDAGGRIAADIAKLSEGVVNGLWMHIGKYRNDELPQLVNAAHKRIGILTLQNGPVGNQCDIESGAVIPIRNVTSTVRVPWFADGQSDQDLEATLNQDYVTDDGTFHIGAFRFTSDQKTAMEAFITDQVKFKRVTTDNKPFAFALVNDDDDLGHLSDDTISEEMNNVQEGEDDSYPSGPTVPAGGGSGSGGSGS